MLFYCLTTKFDFQNLLSYPKIFSCYELLEEHIRVQSRLIQMLRTDRQLMLLALEYSEGEENRAKTESSGDKRSSSEHIV